MEGDHGLRGDAERGRAACARLPRFQVTLIVLGLATFSLVFASLHYDGSLLGSGIDESERGLHSRRGDRFWLLGDTLLLLDSRHPRPGSSGILGGYARVRLLSGAPRTPVLCCRSRGRP